MMIIIYFDILVTGLGDVMIYIKSAWYYENSFLDYSFHYALEFYNPTFSMPITYVILIVVSEP